MTLDFEKIMENAKKQNAESNEKFNKYLRDWNEETQRRSGVMADNIGKVLSAYNEADVKAMEKEIRGAQDKAAAEIIARYEKDNPNLDKTTKKLKEGLSKVVRDLNR